MPADNEPYLACATADERRYLAGNGYDTTSPSYVFHRTQKIQELRARYADGRAAAEERIALLRNLSFEPGNLALHTKHLALLGRIHGYENRALPPGDTSGGYAQIAQRIAYFPWPPKTEDDLAVGYHEGAHIIFGSCPGTEPHHSEMRGRVHCCLACERETDEIALTLAPMTRGMQDSLARYLSTYVRSLDAPAAERDAARRVINGNAWRSAQQRHLEHQLRLDAHAEITRWAEEARRPRPLTELERKIADVNKWAREVGR